MGATTTVLTAIRQKPRLGLQGGVVGAFYLAGIFIKVFFSKVLVRSWLQIVYGTLFNKTKTGFLTYQLY